MNTRRRYLLELDLESVARVGDLLYAGQYGRVDLVEAVPHLLGRRAQETVDVRAQLLGRLAFHLRPDDQVLRVLVVRLRIRHTARTPPHVSRCNRRVLEQRANMDGGLVQRHVPL